MHRECDVPFLVPCSDHHGARECRHPEACLQNENAGAFGSPLHTAGTIQAANLRIALIYSLVRHSRDRDIVELIIGYILILLLVWVPKPAQPAVYWITFTWIAVVTVLSRPSLLALGLGFTGLRKSLWFLYAAVLLAGCAIGVASLLHTLQRLFGIGIYSWHLWAYLVWALVQQFILQDYFLIRLLRLMPSTTTAIATAAGLFALVHIPNPVLTIATLFFGFAACWIFVRHRNLYPLALAHCILGTTIAATFSSTLNRHMLVGIGYISYHRQAMSLQRSSVNGQKLTIRGQR